MQLDLKDCEIFIYEGAAGAPVSGAVNNMAGYVANDVTMTVDGITGAVVTGQTFTVAGSTATHTITAHTETLSNTTSITFTPGLTGTVADNAVITFGGQRLKIKVGDGNITYNEKRNIEYKRDRGKLNTVREGDEEPLDVSIDLQWEFVKSDTGEPITPEEAIKGIGAAAVAGWTTTSDDTCEPYAVDIYVIHTPRCTTKKKEAYLLKDYRWETMNHDFKQGMIQTTGKCNIKEAVVTRI